MLAWLPAVGQRQSPHSLKYHHHLLLLDIPSIGRPALPLWLQRLHPSAYALSHFTLGLSHSVLTSETSCGTAQ